MRIRIIALALMGLALLAVEADAGTPWSRLDYSGSYHTIVLVDGVLVPGTVTYSYSNWTRRTPPFTHAKAHGLHSFAADDGSIEGHGVWNWNYNWRADSTRTFNYMYSMNYHTAGGGLVERLMVNRHVTFNANGDLVSGGF